MAGDDPAVRGAIGPTQKGKHAIKWTRLSCPTALIALLWFPVAEMRPAAAAPAAANRGVPTGIQRDDAEYLASKEELRTRYGLDYSLDITLMPQWAAAKGGGSVGNFIYSPSATWTPFADAAAGSGAITFSLQQNRFWTQRDITTLQTHAGFLTPPSDWFTNVASLGQLTYTHTLPGSWNWLSMTLGQY